MEKRGGVGTQGTLLFENGWSPLTPAALLAKGTHGDVGHAHLSLKIVAMRLLAARLVQRCGANSAAFIEAQIACRVEAAQACRSLPPLQSISRAVRGRPVGRDQAQCGVSLRAPTSVFLRAYALPDGARHRQLVRWCQRAPGSPQWVAEGAARAERGKQFACRTRPRAKKIIRESVRRKHNSELSRLCEAPQRAKAPLNTQHDKRSGRRLARLILSSFGFICQPDATQRLPSGFRSRAWR